MPKSSYLQKQKRRRHCDNRDTSSSNTTSLPQKILPAISAAAVFSLFAAVLVLWYGGSGEARKDEDAASADLEVFHYHGHAYAQQQEHQRFLEAIFQEKPHFEVVNDDVTRDETCKEYMSKFLNGTTDFQDECQGMYNAYEAASCSKDTHTAMLVAAKAAAAEANLNKKHHHHHAPDTTNSTDDDVLMDDFYEEWKCCESIYEYYSTHCHEEELDSGKLLGIVGVLVVCSIVKSLLQQGMGMEWLPDAAIYVLVGAVVGGVCRLVDPKVVAEKLTFDNDLFLHILLPPIVFQAALTIDKRAFRRDLFPILSFAILGTFLSTLAVGLITYFLTGLGSGTHLPLLDSLLFGSLISSIDPVATLGILSSVGVSQRDTLFTLIFGESLLNDGIAIVLFETLCKHLKAGAIVDKTTFVEILRRFLAVASGSIIIGVTCGACCALYFYNLYGKHSAVTEVAIFFSWAMIPFYLSDLCGGSGIISIMVMGFFLDYYVVGGNQSDEGEWMEFMQFRCNNDRRVHSEGDLVGGVPAEPAEEPGRCDRLRLAWYMTFSGRGHILSKSRHHVGFVAEVISGIMETAINSYLGLFLLDDNSEWGWKLNGVAIFGCALSRLGMVGLVSGLINMFVCCNFEGALTHCFRRVWSDLNSADNNTENNVSSAGGPQQSMRTTMSDPLLGDYDDDPPTGEEEDEDDDDSLASSSKRFLDMKTQGMLVLAGVRGAVSFALVANVPVYNVVTKQGSQFKAELKAMTSSSILFTLFVFGAMTYFIVRNDQFDPNRERIAGNLTHRLMSMPLGSDNGDEDDSDALASSLMQLEIEPSPTRRTRVISFEYE